MRIKLVHVHLEVRHSHVKSPVKSLTADTLELVVTGDAVLSLTDPMLLKRPPSATVGGREERLDLLRLEGFGGPARRQQERVRQWGNTKSSSP